MTVDPQTAYMITKACYVGGKFAYKQADKRVGAWADEQGIFRQQA